MRKILFMLVTVFANSAFACGWSESREVYMSCNTKSYEEVDNLRNEMSGFFFGIRGVVGTGVLPCEEVSGVSYHFIPLEDRLSYDYLYCILVTTDSEEVAQSVRERLPNDQKINGIFVLPIFQECMTIGDRCYK